MIRKRRQKAIVGARQIRNRVHAQLNEYYAQVENDKNLVQKDKKVIYELSS